MNSLAGISVFIYLSLVVSNKQVAGLLAELGQESEFLYWFGSIFILWKIKDIGGNISRALVLLVFIGVGLELLPRLIEKIKDFNAGRFEKSALK